MLKETDLKEVAEIASMLLVVKNEDKQYVKGYLQCAVEKEEAEKKKEQPKTA